MPIDNNNGPKYLPDGLHKKHEESQQYRSEVLKNLEGLPIDAKAWEIIRAVDNADTVILTAETWAGKSTRVPQFLAHSGYNVIVTEPRVIATTWLASRVAKEMNCAVWDRVWYKIWSQHKNANKTSKNTQITFCTDWLQLIKQLVDSHEDPKSEKNVLLIDEVHERNQNIEVLIAWIKKLKDQNKNLKVVLMSATIDAQSLWAYFNSENETPIISVPGRTHPVEFKQNQASSLIDETVNLVDQWRNVLVFQPGKKEIQDTINTLYYHCGWKNVTILPLHGQLKQEDQNMIYKKHNNPVIIVATNIAQTSVTIPYIDAVVDSGLEKRIEIIDWVETLVLGNISQADSKQRKWRAWRTKPWKYVLCNDTDYADFKEYPIPEIQRTLLDHTYLKILWLTWLKMEDLDFYHQPNMDDINETKRVLKLLDAIDKHDNITKLWSQLARLPVDVKTWRMILEAGKYGLTESILKIAAIKQVGSIKERNKTIDTDLIDEDSDLITQMNLFNYWLDLDKSNHNRTAIHDAMKDAWIFIKRFYMVKQVYKNLKKTVKNIPKKTTTWCTKEDLLKCIMIWMLDNIYKDIGWEYIGSEKNWRNKDRNSYAHNHPLISADPLNIQFENRRGNIIQLDLVQNISRVEPTWLRTYAPHLIEKKNSKLFWKKNQQAIYTKIEIFYQWLQIDEETTESSKSHETIEEFCHILARPDAIETDHGHNIDTIVKHNRSVLDELKQLEIRTGHDVTLSKSQLASYYFELLVSKWIHNTKELVEYLNNSWYEFMLLNPIEILVPNYNKLLEQYPEAITVWTKTYTIEYGQGIYSDTTIIPISFDDLTDITQKDFKQWLFEWKLAKFEILKQDGSTEIISDIDQYKQKNEQIRLDQIFEAFVKKNNYKEEHLSDWDDEHSPETICIDQKNNHQVYIWFEYLWNYLFTKKVYKTLEDAAESVKTLQNEFEEYSQEKQQFEMHYNAYQEATDAFNELESPSQESDKKFKAYGKQLWDLFDRETYTIHDLSAVNEIIEKIHLLIDENKKNNTATGKQIIDALTQNFWSDIMK